jgi:hypothetical protein
MGHDEDSDGKAWQAGDKDRGGQEVEIIEKIRLY